MAAYDKNLDYSDLIAAEAAKGVNADRALLAELEAYGAEVLNRFNLYNSIAINEILRFQVRFPFLSAYLFADRLRK